MNMKDAGTKGRLSNKGDRRGENHPMATLTNDQAVMIREVYTGQRGDITRLAEQIGVARKVISQIIHRRTYQTKTALQSPAQE